MRLDFCDLAANEKLTALAADRIYHAFWQDTDETPASLLDGVGKVLADGPAQFGLAALAEGTFAGNVLVIRSDVAERPDLGPWVAAVWVEPGFRRRGIGAALVREASAEAFARGVERLYLHCRAARRTFYERLGWRLFEADAPRAGMFILAMEADQFALSQAM